MPQQLTWFVNKSLFIAKQNRLETGNRVERNAISIPADLLKILLVALC